MRFHLQFYFYQLLYQSLYQYCNSYYHCISIVILNMTLAQISAQCLVSTEEHKSKCELKKITCTICSILICNNKNKQAKTTTKTHTKTKTDKKYEQFNCSKLKTKIELLTTTAKFNYFFSSFNITIV